LCRNVATLIINRGTIKPGQILVAGNTWCKVRMLTNEAGKAIKEAGPSSPVEVAGWKDIPAAGEAVLQATDEDFAKNVVKARQESKDREDILKSIDDINERRMKDRIAREKRENLSKWEKRAVVANATAASSDSSDEKCLYIILKGKIIY
jgi:translation initiation factor IF-2